MDQQLRDEITRTAHAMADAARSVILPLFRSDALQTQNKLQDGFDPVTQADQAAERAMRDVLARLRPEDGIVGEEYGTQPGQSGLSWVLDPIDGTRGFMSGTPIWGVLIALSQDETAPSLSGQAGAPMFGMVDQPYIGERFWGGWGQAQMTGPHTGTAGAIPLQTRPSRALSQCVLFTTFPEVGTASDRAGFQAVSDQVQLTRYGMDCYAYALLAAGQIDLVIEAGLSNYDIQGPLALIEGAGGIVTDWQGGPAHAGGRVLAAANSQQHAEALAILSKIPLD